MELYDEENDLNGFMEEIENELDEEYQTEEILEVENLEEPDELINSKFGSAIKKELEKVYEFERKIFKFKYNDIRYEAVPLKLTADNSKCIFNILKPSEEAGLKSIIIADMKS